MGNIVIIDDDEASRTILRERVEDHINTCIECKSGEEAVTLFKSSAFTFDLVFLDIRLPDIDGWELLKKIKSFDKSIPVVAITAIILLEDRDIYQKVGFDGLLSKPFKPSEIYEIMQLYLKK